MGAIGGYLVVGVKLKLKVENFWGTEGGLVLLAQRAMRNSVMMNWILSPVYIRRFGAD